MLGLPLPLMTAFEPVSQWHCQLTPSRGTHFERWKNQVFAIALVACFMTSSLGLANERPLSQQARTILTDKCFACHGPDEASRATDLRFDQQASSLQELQSGVRAVAPGNLDASELFRRITSTDEDERMPPADSHKQLTNKDVAILREWITAGAPWSEHWAFETPRRPVLPQVRNFAFCRNPIDYFVLAKLESNAIPPASPADRPTLARRASLTLTGLLPDEASLRAFLTDTRHDAYERYVDSLLHSPAYAEHQTRYWLDAARYGDTHGLHLDNERSIWRYRDWVINAFQQNLPFDQFTVEQLAGDMLPNASLDQKIATGFHRCNVTTSEGGAIAEEFLARYAVDRVETTATVWMGLTAGCAACHDHKFDPLSQREFYQLYAYFYNLTEKAMDGNALVPPPAIRAPTYLQQLRQAELRGQQEELASEIAQRREQLRQDRHWEARLQSAPTVVPTDDLLLHVDGGPSPQNVSVEGSLESVPGKVEQALDFSNGGYLQSTDRALADFERDEAFSYGAWVRTTDRDAQTVLSKMDDAAQFRGYDLYLGGGKVFVHLVHQWDSNAIRVNTELPLRRQKWQHVFVTYDGSSRASGLKIYVDGDLQDVVVTHDKLQGSIRTDKPLRIGRRDQGAFFTGQVDELRIYRRLLTAAEVQQLAQQDPLPAILAMSPEDRTQEQDALVVDRALRTLNEGGADLLAKHQAVRETLTQLENQFPHTLVMQDREERRQAFMLQRGQYDQPGDSVEPNVPSVLPPVDAGSAPTRLTLAKWLVSEEHPLTARVIVNRFWQQHFGTGLVKTTEDFGSQGEPPSHPDLLDYLATEFIASGWDIRSLHRLIVTSATFQQSSRVRNDLEDPENRLLTQGPRFRLDAEVLRDIALQCGNLLVDRVGGRSVKPYQPTGLWRVVGYPTSTTSKFQQDHGASLYRRSLYTFWKRTAPPPAMQILDAPTREVCVVRRPRTNTPGAALLLMNDVQFVEAARGFAERLLSRPGNDHDRLQRGFQIALCRAPTTAEQATLLALLSDLSQAYAEDPQLAQQLLAVGEHPSHDAQSRQSLAAWTVLTSTLLNLDELLTQH